MYLEERKIDALFFNNSVVCTEIKNIADYLYCVLKEDDYNVKLYGDTLYIDDECYSVSTDTGPMEINNWLEDNFYPYQICPYTYSYLEEVGLVQTEDISQIIELETIRAREISSLEPNIQTRKQYYNKHLNKDCFIYAAYLTDANNKTHIISISKALIVENKIYDILTYTLPEERYRELEEDLTRLLRAHILKSQVKIA